MENSSHGMLNEVWDHTDDKVLKNEQSGHRLGFEGSTASKGPFSKAVPTFRPIFLG